VSFGPVSLAVAPEADTPTVAEERDDDPPSAVAVETAAVSIKLPVVESIAHTATGNGHSNGNGNGYAAPGASLGATRVTFKVQEDSPSCAECGSIMVRNGSCYKCLNCGSTSGCS
jgi:ribonucleoside-diphosphate reductase alpha chain